MGIHEIQLTLANLLIVIGICAWQRDLEILNAWLKEMPWVVPLDQMHQLWLNQPMPCNGPNPHRAGNFSAQVGFCTWPMSCLLHLLVGHACGFLGHHSVLLMALPMHCVL